MTPTAWLAMYGQLFALLLPVFTCAAIGAIWALRERSYPGEFVSRFVTSVTTPALVFHTLLVTQLSDESLLQVGSATLVGLAIAAACGAVLLRSVGLQTAALLPTVTFPNSANLGLPVAQATFGDQGLAVAVVVYTTCSLLQHTMGVWVMGRSRGGSSASWPRGVAFACVLAAVLRVLEVRLPAPVLESARLVGSLTVPLMLISLGFTLAKVSRAGMRGGSLLAVMRIACGSAAAIGVSSMLGLPPLIQSVLVLEFLMPVAVVNYLYASRLTEFGEIVAGSVLISTLTFVLLSPVLLWFVVGTN
jgi:predicted permease